MQRSGAKTGPFPGDPNPGGGGAGDHKVLVDNSDVVPEFLASKLISSDSSIGISTVDLGGGQRVVDLQAAPPTGFVESVSEGPGISVDNTDPVNPVVSADPAYSGRIAPRVFAFSNVAANYLPILQIPIAEYTKFGIGFDIIIRWSGTSSTSVLRYVNGQRVGNSGSAIFELISGYCPPQLWASGQNLSILERTNGATKEWYLQAQLAYLDLTATVEVVNGWTADGITPTWLTSAFVAGAPAGDNPTHLNAQWKNVRAGANDATPEFLGAKLESSDSSITVSVTGTPGSTQKVNVVAASTTSGAPNGEQMYKFALNESESAISQAGTGSGNNSGTRGFGFIPDRTLRITKMRIWISQVGGSNVRLGVYDASGNLVAVTARFSPSVGIVTANLVAPATLTGGTLYYMALWTDDTTSNLRYLVVTGRSTTTTSPLIQRHDPNEMPASIASGLSNTAMRPWMMVSE